MISDAGHRIVAAKREEVLAKAHQMNDTTDRDILSLLSETHTYFRIFDVSYSDHSQIQHVGRPRSTDVR